MKYLISILFCLISFFGFCQTRPSGNPTQFNTGWQKWGWQQADSGTILPRRDTTFLPRFSGTLVYRPADRLLYFYDSTELRWKVLASSGSGLINANNGLSASGSTVQLGQAVGGSGATLLNSREIPMSDSSIYFRNGIFNITADHRVDVSHPIFRVSSTSTQFHEMAEFRAKFVQESWFVSDSSDGYSGTGYKLGNTQYLGVGIDGVADHAYLQIKNGFPLWIENSASSVMAAFEEDGDCGIALNGADRKLGIGVNIPSYKVDVNRAKTSIASSDRLFNVNDAGTTYNTNAAGLTNTLTWLETSATRSAGANNLTNQALYIRASGAQINHGLYVDTPSTIVHGIFSNTNAYANFVYPQVVNNVSSTQKYVGATIIRTTQYNDSAAGIEANGAAALDVQGTYRFKASGSLQDNLSGGALKASLFWRRSVLGYTGAQTVTGFPFPTNDVTSMPTAFNCRFDMSQVQTGGNSIRLNGWWAGITSWLGMNTGNSIGKFVWINTGAMQNTTGTTVDTGYALYINRFPSTVGIKYAIYQDGTVDSLYIAGITRHANLTPQTDTTNYKPMAVSANGTVYKMASWPAGGAGMAIGGNITGATQGSVLFAGASGVLAQDNAAFNYTDANNALYVDSVRTLRAQAPIVVGGTGTTDDLILRTTTGVGASGSDMIFQGGNNGGTEFARFLNSGNFGVGVTNPTSKIHSSGDIKANGGVIWGSSANGTLNYSGNDAYMDASISGGALFFRTNAAATTVMKMLPSTGRVLIGSTTDLGRKLQVTGSAYITDSLLLGNLPAGANTDSVVVINSNVVKKISTSVNRSPLYNAQSGTTYTVLTTDASTIIGLSNTAARTITLAAANAYPAGTIIWFKDEAGTAGTGNITINRAGADTIDGATSAVIATNYGLIGIYTNGSNAWFIW